MITFCLLCAKETRASWDWVVFVFVVLEIKLRAFPMLGKCSGKHYFCSHFTGNRDIQRLRSALKVPESGTVEIRTWHT
jgi:hypothetical protein